MGRSPCKRSPQDPIEQKDKMKKNSHLKRYQETFTKSDQMYLNGNNINSNPENIKKERDERIQKNLLKWNALENGKGLPPPILLNVSDIKMIEISSRVKRVIPLVREISNRVLSFDLPSFSAEATLKIPPLQLGTNIQIGWIQVMTSAKTVYCYDDEEILSWEIPELRQNIRQMVNDSSGVMVPWIEGDTDMVILEGPTSTNNVVTVKMTDTPGGFVSMALYEKDGITIPCLNFAYYKGCFNTYLVLKNFRDDNYQIIRGIKWHAESVIALDPNKPIGKRIKFIGPCQPSQPHILRSNRMPPLLKCGLQNPTANHSQLLLVRSKGKKVRVFRLPKDKYEDLDNYLLNSVKNEDELFKINKKNYLLSNI